MKTKIRFLAFVLMSMMLSINQVWATTPTLSDLSFDEPLVQEGFESCSTATYTAKQSHVTSYTNLGNLNYVYNNNTSNSYAIASNSNLGSTKVLSLTAGSSSPLIVGVSEKTFGTKGAFRLKLSTDSKCYFGLYGAKDANPTSSSNNSVYLSYSQASEGQFKIYNAGTANAVTGSFSTGDYNDICVIYNNTNSSDTYGNSITLAAKTAHIYINGNAIMSGDNPQAFSLGGSTLSVFRVLPIASSGNKAIVDDVQIWDELPTSGSTTYSVTYNANGATSGSVPTDATAYTSGQSVTVLGNTGNLALTNKSFGGWNTKDDGTGTNYQAGATFSISANTTLYAKWNDITYTDYLTECAVVTNYDINTSLTNVTGAVGNPTQVTSAMSEVTLNFTANTGYNLPSSITVKEGTTTLVAEDNYTWNKSTGQLYIMALDASSFSDALTIEISGSAKTYDVTLDKNVYATTNGLMVASYLSTDKIIEHVTGITTGYTLKGYYTASSGGTLVVNASGVLQANVSGWTNGSGQWIRTSGTMTLYAQYNEPVATQYDVYSNLTNVTSSPAIPSKINIDGGTFTVTISPADGYKLPSTITVSNASHSWNASTGALTVNNPTGDVTITISGTAKTYSNYRTSCTTVTTVTLAAGEHGTAAGTATIKLGASTFTSFTGVTPAAHFDLNGYFDGDTKVINADGTLVSNVSGWTTNDGKWAKDETSATLTAKFTQRTFTVTTNDYGVVTDHVVNEGSSYALPALSCSNTDYTKVGWTTATPTGWNEGTSSPTITAVGTNISSAGTYYAVYSKGAAPTVTNKYQKITGSSQLESGKNYIFVGSSYYAMNNVYTGGTGWHKFEYNYVYPEDNIINKDEDITDDQLASMVWQLTNTSDNYYTFYNAAEEKYIGKTSGNDLDFVSSNPANIKVTFPYEDAMVGLQLSEGSYPYISYYSYESAFEVTENYGSNYLYKQVILSSTTYYSEPDCRTVTSIEITTAPTKTVYTEGETFDPTGLIIQVNYDEGDPTSVTYAGHESAFTFNPSTSTPLTTSHDNVVVTYAGQSDDQGITVNAKVWRSVTFDNNNGEYTHSGNDTRVEDGHTYNQDHTALPTASDYSWSSCDQGVGASTTFVGWTTTPIGVKQSECPTLITGTETISENKTYYAVWASGTAAMADKSLTSANMTGGTNAYGNKKTLNSDGYEWYTTGYQVASPGYMIQMKKTTSTTDGGYIQLPTTFTSNIDYITVTVTDASASSSTGAMTTTELSFVTAPGQYTLIDKVATSETTYSNSRTLTLPANSSYTTGYIVAGGSLRVWNVTVHFKASYDNFMTYCCTQYNVNIGTVTGGSVTADKSSACEGQTVTLTPNASTGYGAVTYDVYKQGESSTKVTVTDNAFTMPPYAVTVDATFAAASYGITYNLNGGEWNGTAGAATYTYGVGIPTLASNVTKNGYSFAGWYDNSELTGEAVTTISTTATGAKAFWAKWNENLNCNWVIKGSWDGWDQESHRFQKATGHSTESTGSVTISIASAGNYELKVRQTDGTAYDCGAIYTFHQTTGLDANIQLCSNQSANCGLDAKVAGDYVFTIDYSTDASCPKLAVTYPAYVTVNFNMQGHGGDNFVRYILPNTAVAQPAAPTDPNYAFGGWYENADCTGEAWNFSNTISADKTLYAKWTFNPTSYYYRGSDNSWGATEMTVSEDHLYCYFTSTAATNQFKIALSTTSYDYNHTYEHIGFNGTNITTNFGNYSNDDCYLWDRSGTYYIIVYYPNTVINTTNNPKICASTSLPGNFYVSGGAKLYFDNSLGSWTEGSQHLRIGRTDNNVATAMTKVPGTANLYECTVPAYNNYFAFTVANAAGWTGSNTIYQPSDVTPTGEYAITGELVYQYFLLDKSYTMMPTTVGSTDKGCTYLNTDKVEGMKTQNVAISSYTNGTVNVAYTAVDGTASNFTSGNRDLAHTCILTITATPAAGYQLASLTVNGDAFTSGENYTINSATTITAVFEAIPHHTVSWMVNGSSYSTGSPTTEVEHGGKVTTLPTAPADGTLVTACESPSNKFVGWSTTNIGETPTDTKPAVLFTDAASSPVVNADVTYYAVFAIVTSPNFTFDNAFFGHEGGTAYTLSGQNYDKAPSYNFAFANAGGDAKLYGGTHLRLYGGSQMTISTTGNNMTALQFTYYNTGGDGNEITASPGTYNAETQKWTGNASSVTFTVGGTSGNKQFSGVAITDGSVPQTTQYVTACATCQHEITITKGTAEHGTSSLSLSGVQCIDDVWSTGASTTLTATPDAHYRLSDVNITGAGAAGATKGAISNNTCTISTIKGDVTITPVFTAIPSHTVSWVVNGGAASGSYTTSLYEGDAFSTMTLPTAPADNLLADCSGANKFAGWSQTELSSAAGQSAPADLFKTAAQATGSMGSSNVTFYAIFATEEVNATTWSEFVAGSATSCDFVIASYISNAYKAFANITTKSRPAVVDITSKISNGVISSTNAVGHVVKFIKSTNGYYLQNAEASNKYYGTDGTDISILAAQYASSGEWTVNTGSTYPRGTYRIINVGTTTRTFCTNQTVFGTYGTSNFTSGNTTYYDVELIPITSGTPTYSDYISKCCTSLGTPTNLAYEGTQTGATLSWDAVTGASGYQVKIADGEWIDNASTSYTVTGKSCGETGIAWAVRAKGTGEYCSYSTEANSTFSTAECLCTVQLAYDANTGSGSMSPSAAVSCTATAAARTFTVAANGFTAPDGKMFVKWNTAANGSGTDYLPGADITLSASAEGAHVTTLYAIWDTKYPVRYTGSTSGEIDHYEVAGANVTMKANPVETGYSFTGWTITKDGGGTVDVIDASVDPQHFIMPADGVTVQANMTADVTNLTYYDMGGAEYSGTNLSSLPTTHTYGSPTILPAGVKAGYEFGGWHLLADCSDAAIAELSASVVYGSSLSIYTKWTKASTVTFIDHSVTVSEVEVAEGSEIPFPVSPDCELYTFLGWAETGVIAETTTDPGLTYYKQGDHVAMGSSAKTFRAVYSKLEGEAGYRYDKITSGVTNGNYVLIDQTATTSGFIYTQFNVSGYANVTSLALPENCTTLDETAIPNDAEILQIEVSGSNFSMYDGYKNVYLKGMDGNGIASNGTTKIYDWKLTTGGQVNSKACPVGAINSVNYSTRVLQYVSTGSGRFAGYTNTQTNYVYLFKQVEKGTRYYATEPVCIAPTQITVTYDANGQAGTTLPANTALDYNPYPNFNTYNVGHATDVTGWHFSKWNTQSNGLGTDYAADAEVTTFGGGDAITLYAQWETVYTVTKHDNGATTPIVQSGAGAAIDLGTGASAGHCDKEGGFDWTFVGWTTSSTPLAEYPVCPTLIANPSAYVPAANVDVYAVYSRPITNTTPFSLGVSGAYKVTNIAGDKYLGATTGSYYFSATDDAAQAQVVYVVYKDNKYSLATNQGFIEHNDGTSVTFTNTANGHWDISQNGDNWMFKMPSTYAHGSDRWLSYASDRFNMQQSQYKTAIALTPATGTYYYSNPVCQDGYNITFTQVGGTVNYGSGKAEDYQGLTGGATVTTFPTIDLRGDLMNWAFVGWSVTDYNTQHAGSLDDEGASIDVPAGAIYRTDGPNKFTMPNTNVTLYPVFTSMKANEPLDLEDGGDYYVYFTSDNQAGFRDPYYAIDGHTIRVYAEQATGTGSGSSFSSTQHCSKAQMFHFEKRAGETDKWNIRLWNSARTDYILNSYLTNPGTLDNALASQGAEPEGYWTIEQLPNGSFKAQYSVNAGSTYFMKGLVSNPSIQASATFKCYSQDCDNSTQYYAVYLGSCEERTFSSNPNPQPDLTIEGVVNITSRKGENIAVRGAQTLTLQGIRLTEGETITITSDNADVYFSTTTAPNFTKASKPLNSVTVTVPADGNVNMPIYVHYKPSVNTDGIETVNVTVSASAHTLLTSEVKIHCRHLPDQFVIAAKVGTQWYALPANMTAADNPLATPITVNEATMVAEAPTNCAYMMWPVKTTSTTGDRYEAAGEAVRFAAVKDSAALWASDATDTHTTIKNGSKIKTIGSDVKNPNYEWAISTSDLKVYTLTATGDNNQANLVINRPTSGGKKGQLVWGTYGTSETSQLYLLPFTTFTDMQASVVEWFRDKVLVELADGDLWTAMQTAGTTSNSRIGEGEWGADAAVDYTTYGTKLCVFNTGSLLNQAGNQLSVKVTVSETDYQTNLEVPIIISRGNKSITEAPFSTLTAAKYNNMDLVVRDGAHLNANGADKAANTFRNVTIYPTSKLRIDDGKAFQANGKITLRGGKDEIYDGSKYEMTPYGGEPQLYAMGELHHPSTDTIYYEKRVDTKRMYQTSLPVTVPFEKVTYLDGSPMARSTQLWAETWDGQAAANEDASSHWILEDAFTPANQFTAGVGYTVSCKRQVKGQKFSIIRFPMFGHTSGDPEAKFTAYVGVTLWQKQGGKGRLNSYGWNYIGNPYMTAVEGKIYIQDSIDDEKLTLLNYITYMSPDGSMYYSGETEFVEMLPFRSYFAQVPCNGRLVISNTARKADAPARKQTLEDLVKFYLYLQQGDQNDFAGMRISVNYPDTFVLDQDLAKFSIGPNTSVYLIDKGGNLAFDAVNPAHASNWIPVGFYAPNKGEMTFSLDTKEGATNLKHVYLQDVVTKTQTDLLTDDYVFTTDQTGQIDNRFFIAVEFTQVVPTGIDDVEGTRAPFKFMHEDKLFIEYEGRIYDANGKRVNL